MIENIQCLKRMILLKSTNGSTIELERRCRIMWIGTLIISVFIVILI